MSSLLRAAELFVEIGLEVWSDRATAAARREASARIETEEVAELRNRLALCVSEMQRVHEIDAQIALLATVRRFEGRERCLARLRTLRGAVLHDVRTRRASSNGK